MGLIIHQAHILRMQLGKEQQSRAHEVAGNNAADSLKCFRELSDPGIGKITTLIPHKALATCLTSYLQNSLDTPSSQNGEGANAPCGHFHSPPLLSSPSCPGQGSQTCCCKGSLKTSPLILLPGPTSKRETEGTTSKPPVG